MLVRVDETATLPDFFCISAGGYLPAIDVVVRVIANGVAFCNYPVKDRGMPLDVMANAKKGGLDILLAKYIKYKFCWSGNRAVIECEVKAFLRSINPP